MPNSPVTTVEALPDIVLIRVVPDSLDEDQLLLLRSDVRESAAANPGRPCVIDLGGVSFLPSLSLAALITLHTEFQARGQRLILAGLQDHVRDVFRKTRLDRALEIRADVAAATRAVRPI